MMQKLLSRALQLFAVREHSEHELRNKLQTRFFSTANPKSVNHQQDSATEVASPEAIAETIDAVIDYCYQHNWLDDERFCHHYLASRARKGYGPQRIRSELLVKGIDKNIVQHIFSTSEIDWCLQAKAVAQRKFGDILPTQWCDKIKVQNYLLYRGYFHTEIQSIYRDLA